MPTYFSVLTDDGLALYAAAIASNTAVNLVSMAVGDGNGNPVTPVSTMTALVNEVDRFDLSNDTVDSSDPTIFYPEIVIPYDEGGYTIREIGLYTDGGVLFAVANFPATPKPVVSDGSTRDLVIRFGLKLANSSAVNIVINPAIVTATHDWVLSILASDKSSAQSVATTGGSTTLNSTQYGAEFITVTGVLASDATLIFPAIKRAWYVINNTSGAHTLTCKTASGTGVAVTQGKMDRIVGDGTNINYSLYDVGTRTYGDSSDAAASTKYVDRAVAQVGGYYQDTGSSANAYVIALNPALTAYDHSFSVRFRTTRANTGATTLDFGPGPVPLVREDGAALQSGDIPGTAILAVTYDLSQNKAVVNELVLSQLGALAKEGFGQGIEDDGAGNARVKLADNSLRRTASGIQANKPTSSVSGIVNLTAADNGKEFVLTGDTTFNAPLGSSLWNGFYIEVVARDGSAIFTPNAADKVNNATVGSPYSIGAGQSANFTCDGAGAPANWTAGFVTSAPGGYYPRRIAAATTVAAGTYEADTSGGPFTINLPAGPSNGDSCTFIDPYGTWGVNNLTIGRNGNTIEGAASDLVCNWSGVEFKLFFNGSTWRLE